MSSRNLTRVVYLGDHTELERAARFLRDHGIASRHGRPRGDAGLLRVDPTDAEKAREVLASRSDLSKGLAGAAWFNCHRCDALLSAGQAYCHECGAYNG